MKDSTSVSMPRLAIELNGEPVSSEWLRAILRVDVSRALSCPARALIVIETDAQPPHIGSDLTIRLAYVGETLFAGKVGALEVAQHGAEARRLTVYAEDAVAGLRAQPTGSATRETTAVEVARAAAEHLGVPLRVSGDPTEATGVRILAGESRFADLVAETRATGLYFHLRDGDLWLHGLTESPGRTVSVTPDEVLHWQIEHDETTPIDVVSIAGWYPSEGTSVSGMAFGLSVTRDEASAPQTAGGERALWNRIAANETAALAEAGAEIDRLDAARIVLTFGCDGSRRFGIGDVLDASALDVAADRLLVTRIDERVTVTEGHVVEVSTRPPPPAQDRSGCVLFSGRVTDNADPARRGRVRCALPAHASLETGWLSVLRPLAGDTGGFSFVPGVGADVAILAADRNLANGVVIGSLPGTRELPLDCGDSRRLGIMSEGGQSLVMDDEASSVTLQSDGGTRLSLDPDGGRLTAEGDLVLEAPGRRITIRADRIDFERG